MKLNNKLLFSIFILILILIGFKITSHFSKGQITNIDTDLVFKIIFFVLFMWFVIQNYISWSKNHASNFYTSMLLWFSIFAFLIIGYAFRFELESFKNKVLSVLVPSYSWTNKQGQLVIARNQDGHFYLDAITADNRKIKFLIDTGASDIALTKQDAIKLGFNLSNLKYTRQYSTANGLSYAAPVRIKQLTIGKKTFFNLEAHINSGGLDISLLGMSLIGNFRDFKITNDLLILSY